MAEPEAAALEEEEAPVVPMETGGLKELDVETGLRTKSGRERAYHLAHSGKVAMVPAGPGGAMVAVGMITGFVENQQGVMAVTVVAEGGKAYLYAASDIQVVGPAVESADEPGPEDPERVGDGMSDLEREVVRRSTDLTKAYAALILEEGSAHPSHNRDVADAVHVVQRIIAMRVARRANPEVWGSF